MKLSLFGDGRLDFEVREMYRIATIGCLLLLSACAAPAADPSVRIKFRTPEEFCQGTGRSIAIDRYNLKNKGASLREALDLNNGVPVIDAITRAVYASDSKSESQAATAGLRACRDHFRSR
jgi:hypothetical protein